MNVRLTGEDACMLWIRHIHACGVLMACAKPKRPLKPPQSACNGPWEGQNREGSITSLVQCSRLSRSFTQSGTCRILLLTSDGGQISFAVELILKKDYAFGIP